MRLTTIILITTMLHASALTKAQTISISKSNVTLVEVFSDITKQTDYDFIYSSKQLIEAKKVTINVKNASIKDVLDQCFKEQPFSYDIRNKIITIKKKKYSVLDRILDSFNTSNAQQAIPGKVISASTGEALPGAVIKNTTNNQTALSNDRGEFTLNLANGKYNLSVYYLSYKAKNIEIQVPLKESLVIALDTDNQNLKEVEIVSTGYQNIPKERATGSFVQPNTEMFNARVSSDIFSRLEGITSGLLFNRSTSATQQGKMDINIRGRSTIYANDQPLIVVDNFPYNGNINDINPQDVESINILKDAAASSIWGVKAGNGVIVITTKKGELNKAVKLSATANISIGEKPDLLYDPNFLPADGYIDLQQFLFKKGKYDADLLNVSSYPVIPAAVEIMAAKRAGSISMQDSINKIEKLKSIDIRDGLSKYYYVHPVNQQYAFNISTGTKNSSYYFSTGYDKAQTNLSGTYNDRITLSFFNTYIPAPKIEITTRFNYALSSTHARNALTLASATSVGGIYYPYTAFADENGNAVSLNRGYSNSYINKAMDNGFLNWEYVPLLEKDYGENISSNTDARIFIGTKYSILKDFAVEAKYQYQKYNTKQRYLQDLELYTTRDLINRYAILSAGKVSKYNVPPGDVLSLADSWTESNNFRGQLNYNHTGIKHAINAIAGIEIIQYDNSSNSNILYGYDNETDSFTAIDGVGSFKLNPTGSGSIPGGVGIYTGIERFRSYFINASYGYNGKYIASLSARQDGSNYFGVATNQKTVPLWSTGFKWNISSEDFYKPTWLPTLSFRATYGYNGNLDKSVTGVTTFKYNTNATWTSLPYATISNIGNPELRWEKNGILNLGMDFSSKNNILSGSIEYFFKHGRDLLGDQLLASSVGYISPSTGTNVLRGNFANMRGRGLDVQLTSKNITKGITWYTTINFSQASDKVTRYDQVKTTYGSFAGDGISILPAIGKPVYSLYSYKWAGLDPNNGDPQGWLDNKISKDYNLLTNPASLTELVYNGPSRPRFFGGLANHFKYKQFSLLFNISYKLDYYFRRSTINYNTLTGSAGTGHKDFMQRWMQPGDETKTTVPSLVYPASTTRDLFYKYSEATVEKGDHIRLQDINISYSFIPLDKRSGTQIRRYEVFAYASNIGILWKANKLGLDPDLGRGGIPAGKLIAFGLKASL